MPATQPTTFTGGVAARTVPLGEVELGVLAERERTLLRRDRIGVVFQAFNLLPALTAADNITLPSAIAGRPSTLSCSPGWPTGAWPASCPTRPPRESWRR